MGSSACDDSMSDVAMFDWLRKQWNIKWLGT